MSENHPFREMHGSIQKPRYRGALASPYPVRSPYGQAEVVSRKGEPNCGICILLMSLRLTVVPKENIFSFTHSSGCRKVLGIKGMR